MIAGIFHQGSGLGNQLFRYVTTRVLAEDKGYEWEMQNAHLFKGKDFMQIEISSGPSFALREYVPWHEKKVVENGVDIRGYDPEINFVEDNTIIDGEFQDERYWGHRLDDIRKWLGVKPYNIGRNQCVIGFRGGEYALYPDLFLPHEYWDKAMSIMEEQYKKDYPDGSKLFFTVVTDDPATASHFFKEDPNKLEITHEIAHDWTYTYSTPYLIISNSSFYILPALLNKNARKIIAPRYWARHNTQTWALPQNYYKAFTYL